MTPLELFGLICVLGVVRVAMALRPAPITSVGATITTSPGIGAEIDHPRSSWITVAQEYIDAFIVAGLVALFLITFVVRTFYIPSGSMLPTLQINDVLLANEFEYRFSKPKDGDIVVFTPAVPTTSDFIKRLIGSPGETLRISGGTVIRNGTPLNEPYIAQKPNYDLEIKDYGIYVNGIPLDPSEANIPPKSMWSAPDRIPANCYFMMGDNRNDSEDSHIWGFAQLSGTFATGQERGKPAGFTGHAFVVFWPASRLRVLH